MTITWKRLKNNGGEFDMLARSERINDRWHFDIHPAENCTGFFMLQLIDCHKPHHFGDFASVEDCIAEATDFVDGGGLERMESAGGDEDDEQIDEDDEQIDEDDEQIAEDDDEDADEDADGLAVLP